VSVVLATVLLSGCANLGQLAREQQQIPITVYNSGEAVKESGAVFLWPPYASAAVVDNQGNRCVLAASGAKTIDASTEAALKIGKALEKIEGLDVSTKWRLLEAFTKISAADAHAAFADVALFHLCMLDQNGTFKNMESGKAAKIMDAYLKTIEAARELK
jgi:hypothetical protein